MSLEASFAVAELCTATAVGVVKCVRAAWLLKYSPWLHEVPVFIFVFMCLVVCLLMAWAMCFCGACVCECLQPACWLSGSALNL